MFLVSNDDVVAMRRAFMRGGRDAAALVYTPISGLSWLQRGT
jgi:hypothetical protein